MFAQDADYVFGGEEEGERAADSDDEDDENAEASTAPFDPEVQKAYSKRKGDFESLLDNLTLKGNSGAEAGDGTHTEAKTLPDVKETPEASPDSEENPEGEDPKAGTQDSDNESVDFENVEEDPFYDDAMDSDDEKWVVNNLGSKFPAKDRCESNGIALSCPCCFELLSLDCQRCVPFVL
jgi:hypothetical protein